MGTMDREKIMTRAAAWMQARRRKQKLAKRREHEQTFHTSPLLEMKNRSRRGGN